MKIHSRYGAQNNVSPEEDLLIVLENESLRAPGIRYFANIYGYVRSRVPLCVVYPYPHGEARCAYVHLIKQRCGVPR